MKLFPICLFVLVLSFGFVTASESFIEEDITVYNDGIVWVEGESTADIFPDLKTTNGSIEGYTQSLTLKKGADWYFVYKNSKIYDYYLITVKLPVNSEISSVLSNATYTIFSNEGSTIVTFTGKNKPLGISIKYTIKQSEHITSYGTIIVWTGAIVLLLSLFYFLFRFSKNLFKKKPKHELEMDKINTIKLTLNENQLKILDALMNNKHEASQTKIQYLTNVPKSSLSRNIELMAQKEVISKFYNGTSNYIKIHPSLYKNQ